MSTGLKLILLLGLVISANIVFTIIGVGIGIAAYDVQFSDLMNLDSYLSIQALKITQFSVATGLFVFTPFLFVRIIKEKSSSFFYFNRPVKMVLLVIVIITMAGALPLISWMAGLNESIVFPDFLSGLENYFRSAEDKAMEMTAAFLAMDSLPELAYNLLLVALIPAFGEELLFRGVLQRLLIDKTASIHAGIWISAAIFSAFHNQFYGFFPRMLLGAGFGYLVVWGGSLFYAMAAHFVNNSLGVILHYFVLKNVVNEEIETFGSGNDDLLFVMLSFIITTSGFWLIWYLRKEREPISFSHE